MACCVVRGPDSRESAFPSPDRGRAGLQAERGHDPAGCHADLSQHPLARLSCGAAPYSNLRVAPLLIAQNQSPDGSSDVLAVMGGSGAAGGVSRAGHRQRQQYGGDSGQQRGLCDQRPLSGEPKRHAGLPARRSRQCQRADAKSRQYAAVLHDRHGTTTSLGALSASTASFVTPLGNAAANNLQFELIGVDANHTLYSYDLLQNLSLVQSPGTADAAQAIADGVYQMHAIYGIDTNGDGIQDTWAGPGDANYDINTVMTTPATMRKIIAVRVALVLRGEYYDKNTASPATLTRYSADDAYRRALAPAKRDDQRQ